MLPSFGGTNPGYLAGHKRRKRKEEVPWGLLFLFLLFAGCTLFTRHRSLRAVDPAVDDVAEEVHQPHSVATVHEKAARAARNLRVDSSTFHPTLHSMYQDQPLLPEPSFAALHGGWKLTDAVYDYAAHHPAAEVLSWEAPRLVRFRSFLTPEEVDHMIGMAENHLERSAVLSADDDNERYDNVRTSFGTWPPVDDFMVAINDRIHRLVAIPHGFGEQIYVLNYKLNQRYDAHNDNCMDNIDLTKTADEACRTFLKRAGGPQCGPGAGGDACGDRIATVILVLKAPTKGGATVFPRAAGTQQRLAAQGVSAASFIGQPNSETWYCDREEVLGVKAQPGDALLFWDYKPGNGTGMGSYEDGTADPGAEPVPESQHSGCPVLEGEKWIATRWIRSSLFT